MLLRFARRYALAASLLVTAVAVLLVAAGWAFVGRPPVSAAASLLRLNVAKTRRDAVRVELVSGAGEARYRAQEVLSGRGFNEAVGRTAAVTGGISLDDEGGVVASQSRISVDLTTLQSDNAMRDRYIQRTTLQTTEYPTADFQLTGASGLPQPLPTSGTAAFTLVGDLTVHGVTRPTTWDATATFDDGEVQGTASTTVLLTDFGMEPPRAGPVLSIEDAVRLELDVRGTIAPSLADLLTDAT
jgi:polyisoprenoid-binding protein YceI